MNSNRIKHWLVISLAIVFPWHTQVRLPVGSVNLSLGDPIVAVVGILLLIGVFNLNELPSFTELILGLIIVVILSFILASFRFSELTDPTGGLTEIVKLLAAVSYFVAVVVLFQNETIRKLYNFAVWTAISVFIYSVWTIIQYNFGVHRPPGPFDNPNLYADYLLFAFFLIWLLTDQDVRRFQKLGTIAFTILISLLVISLIGTESRSAVAALPIGILIVCSIKYKSYLKKVYINPYSLLLPSATGIGLTAILLYSDWRVFRRFETFFQGESTGGRFDRWIQSIDVVIESSLLGVGWGQHQQYIISSHTLHNSLVQVFVETGLIGALLLIGIWTFAFRRTIQLSQTNEYRFAVYLAGFLIATIANSMFHNNLNFRTFWIVLGIIGALEIHYLNNSAPSVESNKLIHGNKKGE